MILSLCTRACYNTQVFNVVRALGKLCAWGSTLNTICVVACPLSLSSVRCRNSVVFTSFAISPYLSQPCSILDDAVTLTASWMMDLTVPSLVIRRWLSTLGKSPWKDVWNVFAYTHRRSETTLSFVMLSHMLTFPVKPWSGDGLSFSVRWPSF